ncbi:ribonucleoside triphosphate reductase [Candidatus Saccharibacteria bacterium]|nr:ribonucleoside triphosphate reductase [Candidatus Saccharibacteria bacterium]
MFENIQKRDGRVVPFEKNKITEALTKAGIATGEFGERQAEKMMYKVLAEALEQITDEIPTVEQVQDVVETILVKSRYKETAKAFIIYRNKRTEMRKLIEDSQIDLMDQYIGQMDWRVRENSNMAFSLQGLRNYVASEVTKTYWLNNVYSKEIGAAHKDGDIHIHDLDSLSAYCVGWDLGDLLKEGFHGVAGKISCKPAKHFRSALGQAVNFLYTLQGEAAGAEAFSNFDTLLAPFIRYDKLSEKQVKQALQEFIFNMNVPTRVGFQTPFTNITLDITVPKHMAKTPAVVGGELMDEDYGDFQEEMNIFNKALFEVMTEGDADGRVFTFPIPTINITKDFDWDNPVIENLWEASAKYGLNYFSNFINSDMDPEDARSMCCRLRIDNRQLATRGGGLFGSNPLTGSIGVVTLNLPRLALKARKNNWAKTPKPGEVEEFKENFKGEIEKFMNVAKDSLEVKRKLIEKLTEMDLYPYSKYYLRSIKERTGSYWANHFNTIGLLGMNEALLNLFGENIGSDKGKAFAIEIMDFMRDKLVEYQTETGHNYNLEATPGEGTTYRFAHIDQKDFGAQAHFANGIGADIKVPFYTNSTHLPVDYTDDLFEILDLQDELQAKYTGGTVIHFFLGERLDDTKTLRSLVKKICTTYKLPYFTFSPSFSICKNHGYIAGEHEICAKCNEKCEVYSRVVGYLRPVQQWNDAKQAEFEIRSNPSVEKALERMGEKMKSGVKKVTVDVAKPRVKVAKRKK